MDGTSPGQKRSKETKMNEREIKMFGYTKAQIDQFDAEALGHPMMRIMGLMSDAQEQMTMGNNESARQTLNVAKYLISKHGFNDMGVAA
jgi:hypothetical protein